jgi:glycerophosphoryl diester phosphodiesterase
MKWIAGWGLLGLSALCMAGCGSSVEIIAHRGASYLAPENTMASVMLAWEKGTDAEIDVFLSGDNRIVVIHDSTTKRTGEVDLKVSETPFERLRELDVGRFKGEQFAGERIPLLEEVIASMPPGHRLFVEIKCGREILPFLQPLIVESGKMSQIVIIGFDLETVAASKQLIDVPTYWLKGTEKDKQTEQWIPHDPQLVQIAKDRGLDGINVHYAGVTRELVDAARAAGQKLYVWTVNDADEAIRLARLGVDGITTDRPGWLREQLATRASVRQRIVRPSSR